MNINEQIFSFESPVFLEYGTHITELAKNTISNMQIFEETALRHYKIKWTVPELNLEEFFTITCTSTPMKIDDFDIIFSFPKQIIPWLESLGFNCDIIKNTNEWKGVSKKTTVIKPRAKTFNNKTPYLIRKNGTTIEDFCNRFKINPFKDIVAQFTLIKTYEIDLVNSDIYTKKVSAIFRPDEKCFYNQNHTAPLLQIEFPIIQVCNVCKTINILWADPDDHPHNSIVECYSEKKETIPNPDYQKEDWCAYGRLSTHQYDKKGNPTQIIKGWDNPLKHWDLFD